MKILKQLAKEFWLPLILSTIWVLYNIYGGQDGSEWTTQKVVNVFGPTFFLLSWLTGQFFRVKKQTRVEDSFGTMELRLNELLDQIEKKTNDMINHIPGGNSFPWLQISAINNESNTGLITAIHNGEHPLYDINARIVNLQKFEKIKHNFSLESMKHTDTNITIGNMIPSHAKIISSWKIDSEPEQSYNIFFTARNGSFTQLLRLKKISGTWVCATKVTNKDNETLHEQIDELYPRDTEGNITW